MAERGFDTTTWDSDDWFQELSRDQRYLFIYLWTNNHCNPAGLYRITLTTLANETKFSKEELPAVLQSLEAKVKWYPQQNLIWVKNFIKHQSKSSKFLMAAAKNLISISNNGLIHELLDFNLAKYSISIPYQYYINRVPILTRVTVPVPDTKADKKGGIAKGGNIGGIQKEEKREIADSVLMTEEQLGKLIAQFGEEGAKNRMEKLSLYKQSTGKSYKSDYHTILSWERKDKEAPSGKRQGNPRPLIARNKYTRPEDFKRLGQLPGTGDGDLASVAPGQ